MEVELSKALADFASAFYERNFSSSGLLGWAEALTAIGAAYATRMIPLRTTAILNNVLGLIAGAVSASPQAIVEHLVNLPLNFARMQEMRRLIVRVRQANEPDLNLEWLKPFMHPRSIKARTKMFAKGDEAREAFLLVEGNIEIPERSITLAPGALFGEMAFFTAKGTRTASAIAVSDVRLLVMPYNEFEQLYFQNPEFGLYLIRLIVRRFEMNHPDADVEGNENPSRGASPATEKTG